MPNKKINELSPRTPSLTDLIIVGDPSTGYSYKATISVLTAFAGSNIQFSSLGGISLTSPANGQVLQFNGTSWVNYTPTTWNTAYDRSLVSAAVSGSTTKTLTLTKQDGSTLTATWSDLNTDAVTSVFGRTGAVVATEGDYSLDLLSDVTLSTPTTNQVLQYNGTAWVNATFVAGINSLNGLTATTQTLATGTSGTDFAISSTTSTHTFNLPTASATNRGALSSADWTTFNSKVGGSGTTNYLSKWTSSSALGNSLVFDNGTNVGIGTTSPAYKLDVSGDIRSSTGTYLTSATAGIAQGFANNNIGLVTFGVNTSGNALVVNDIDGAKFAFATGGFNTTFYKHRSTDNKYYTTFVIKGSSATSYGTGFDFYVGTSIAANISSNGNLLLGTTTDAGFRLDVSGTFRSTGDANINGLTVGRGGGSVSTNTAVGVSSLAAITTGYSNTAIGNSSMSGVQNGYQNTSVGAESMPSLVGGIANVAVGFRALRLNTSSYQTGVGWNALSSSTGGYNTAFGYRAGLDVTTGGGNIFVGVDAGLGITTGNNNTIIGSNVTGLSSSLSNTIILADGQGNQRLYINNSGNVGIGATTTIDEVVPSYRSLTIQGSTGSYISLRNSTTQIGTIENNGNSIDIKAKANVPLNFATNNVERGRFTAAGRLLIGTTTESTYLLDVNGTARVQSDLTLRNGYTLGNSFVSARLGIVSSSTTNSFIDLYPNAVTGNSDVGFTVWSKGSPSNITNYELLEFRYDNTNRRYSMNSIASGTGSVLPMIFYTGTNTSQLYLNTNGNIGIGTTSPNASALLDVSSTTKGFLPPRMTGANAEAIGTPASGLLVYINNGNGTTITSTGWWGYDGTTWVKLN